MVHMQVRDYHCRKPVDGETIVFSTWHVAAEMPESIPQQWISYDYLAVYLDARRGVSHKRHHGAVAVLCLGAIRKPRRRPICLATHF
jgi:hypothetical protein